MISLPTIPDRATAVDVGRVVLLATLIIVLTAITASLLSQISIF